METINYKSLVLSTSIISLIFLGIGLIWKYKLIQEGIVCFLISIAIFSLAIIELNTSKNSTKNK